MTTDEVIAELSRRELEVVVRDGKPILRGRKERMTASLLKVLRWHREPLLERLSPRNAPVTAPERNGLREWLWRHGHRYQEIEPGEPHPGGAWWWRHQGETGWQVIEERLSLAVVGAESLRAGHHLPPGERLAGRKA